MVKRIYLDEFRKEWNRAYNAWDSKFYLKAKNPISQYNDGGEIRCFEPRGAFWCHLWQGEHCMFGSKELLPQVTIVSGSNTSPVFFTPTEVVEQFEIVMCNPFTNESISADSAYGKSLINIWETIKKNAEAAK